MRYYFWSICISAIFACTVSASQPTIVVGDHQLQPNQPDQTIILNVTGGDSVAGLNFNAQIGDGGAEAGGSVKGPKITFADIVSNTPFATNNSGMSDAGSIPQLAIKTITTANGTVSASGQLASLTFDTTGVAPGVYSLKLFDTLNGSTSFLNSSGDQINTLITDGTVTVVPEPASAVLAGVLITGILWRRRWE